MAGGRHGCVGAVLPLFMLALDVLVSFIQAYVFTFPVRALHSHGSGQGRAWSQGEGHDPEVGKKEAAELKSEEAALHKLAAEMDMNK